MHMSLLFRLALMFTSGRFSDSNPVAHPISICSPYSCSVSLSAALLCRLLLRIMFPFILVFFPQHIYDFLLPLSILLSKPFAPTSSFSFHFPFFLCWVTFFVSLPLPPFSFAPFFIARASFFSLPFFSLFLSFPNPLSAIFYAECRRWNASSILLMKYSVVLTF